MTNDIIYAHEGLINSIINKYTYYFDRDDLYQVAAMGLIKAYQKFDRTKQTEFSTYAYLWIKGEVTNYIRESNTFKISKDMAKLNRKIDETRNILSQKLNRVPTDKEISMYLEIPEDKIYECSMANKLVESLDLEKEELDLYSRIGYEEKEYKPEILDLKKEVDNLPEFDKNLIKERYENGLTQSETSKTLGISQVQVSRKEKDILKRLRTRLE